MKIKRPEFEVGQRVMSRRTTDRKYATIVKVHSEDPTDICYDIQFDDGYLAEWWTGIGLMDATNGVEEMIKLI